jgi:hypothetical protein
MVMRPITDLADVRSVRRQSHLQRPDQSVSPRCLNKLVNDPNPIFERDRLAGDDR